MVEVLIAMALGSLLFVMLHQFLQPILLGSSKNTVQVHLSQQANLLLTRIERDLKSSDGSALSYTRDEQLVALAICRRAGLGPNGNKLYEQGLSIYFWDVEASEVRLLELKASELPSSAVTDVSRPVHLEPGQLRGILTPAPPAKLLANSVVEFAPLQEWPPEPVSKIVLQLERATGGSAQKAAYRIEKSVAFR